MWESMNAVGRLRREVRNLRADAPNGTRRPDLSIVSGGQAVAEGVADQLAAVA